MPVDRQAVLARLRAFQFSELFTQELGWDWYTATPKITVGKLDITLQGVAEKRGVHVFLCPPAADGRIPDATECAAIERQTAKIAREHLLIFTNTARTEQVWLYPHREPGKPIRLIRYPFEPDKANELLLQKLSAITFSINEEEGLNLLGVTQRLKDALDRDVVTKAFYQRFEKERSTFQEFLEGIPDEDMERWYVAVMMNRLMFIYFIQEKGFLGGGTQRYLQDHLAACKGNYYTDFLCPLFFQGFALRETDRPATVRTLLGQVPYLNGGIFEKHEIETAHGRTIKVPNEAFTRLFAFFDDWRWHLDERPIATGKEINPEILGYIFEKFINQRQMGAYYTKEDITGYISRNSILPYLFAAVRQKCKAAFEGEASVWHLLRDDPDRYIYAPVRKGAELPLPANIAAGETDVAKRGDWNAPAPATHALPTETWREVVARRQRYKAVRSFLEGMAGPPDPPTTKNQEPGTKNGEISIDDLITHNLDIVQFAQDVVENAEPDLLNAFYNELKRITVLDPTCGSGAFLFAALNILAPLYEACLNRMRVFLDQWKSLEDKTHRNYAKWFAAEIETIEKNHPSQPYFILKTIILNNLYGVDIMKEATEICKLRLFLKLAAQATPDPAQSNLGIEPLPDIDFNICAGNTLVGFASEKQAEDVISQDLLAYNTVWPEVQRDAKEIAELFSLFRQQQTEIGGAVSAQDKAHLRAKLAPLEDRLNTYLAGTYDVTKKTAIKDWIHSHKPFHWFVEFYEIIANGGFSAIVGNPPYVEWSNIADYYVRGQYSTIACGNIYTAISERCYRILGNRGRFGMIVPLSSVATDRMAAFRDLWRSECLTTMTSHYSGDAHPSILFNGVKFRLTILLQAKGSNPSTFTTHFQRWYAEAREFQFPQIAYEPVHSTQIRHTLVPKISSPIHNQVLGRLCSLRTTLASNIRDTSRHDVYCHRIVAHFVKAVDFVPYFKSERDGRKKSEDYKVFPVDDAALQSTLSALLNSNLFYCWFVTYSDVYHCGRDIIMDFPVEFTRLAQDHGQELARITERLMGDLRANSMRRKIPYKTTGMVSYDEFYPRKSKPIIDEIDRVLAKHYGLTDEELDFIINYDIKYRMGRAEGEDEED